MQTSYKCYEMQDSKKYCFISTDNMEQVLLQGLSLCCSLDFWLKEKVSFLFLENFKALCFPFIYVDS